MVLHTLLYILTTYKIPFPYQQSVCENGSAIQMQFEFSYNPFARLSILCKYQYNMYRHYLFEEFGTNDL